MTRDVKRAVGQPDNSVFIGKCIFYGIALAVMLFAAPSIFAKIMAPMAADGITVAWYAVFVPLTVCMMVFGLFRAWRRRWPLAYMRNYQREARDDDYDFCPRCGARMVERQRTIFSREKVGQKITTTTYTDGSTSKRSEDIYGNVGRTQYYHICTNPSCQIEAEQNISQSHLPWTMKQIRCLVLNDSSLLGRNHPSASHLLLSRLLVPILALVLILASGASIYAYADVHDGVWTYAAADREAVRSEDDYQNYLLSLDTGSRNWHMSYEKEPTDMMRFLGGLLPWIDHSVGYSMESYATETGNILYYRFEGDDAGTGIPDGWYCITEFDGVNVLMDDINKKIYKQGTAFYDTYAPKLLALTHDKVLTPILERTDGGEHALSGTNDFWMEYVRKDGTMVYSYMLSSDVTKVNGGEFRVVTTHPQEQMMETWMFSYDDAEFTPDDLDGYVYSDAAPEEEDELGKLLQTSFDDTGSVAFFKNDEVVLGISVEYFPNGYTFEIEVAAEGYADGLEEDMVYRVNTTDKTLTKYINDHGDLVDGMDMPLSEHQDTYDFLLSIVPHTYIRSLIDMDQAEVRKESLGLVTVYEMKDENGNVTADLKLMFGKIGEVNHYTGENEYVKIELEY